MKVEAVAEDARRLVREERALAPPAGAVAGIERVEVQVPAVRIERRADARRTEAVYRLTLVRVAAEHVLEAAVVRPVEPDLDRRQVTRPVGRVELRVGAVTAVIRLQTLPALERPVAVLSGASQAATRNSSEGPVYGRHEPPAWAP